MSAFAVIFEPSNTSVEPGVLERVMERLNHRGPDGRDVYLAGQVAMGHWHFWTTPEEVGERQPLRLEGLPFRIVFDGRLDNRAELLDDFGLNNVDGRRLSDAALILQAYDRWGKDCFEHFIGEFALAIFDEARDELVCGRDALGDRSLFYAIKGSRVVIASEPWAAAGAEGSWEKLNESAVAHYFALRANENGETLFNNVYELLPAHGMFFSDSGTHSWRYWRPNPSIKIRGKSDQEYAEGFLILLEEAVRCRLRSNSPAAIMMSGGLDSTSVASLAARMIAPTPLTTISYVFDELQDCDERKYIGAMQDRWGIYSIQIPCDDLWPYRNLQDRPRSPNGPDGNLYRMLIERTYQRAVDAGLRVLLTGHFGDQLYDGEDDWLADLISERRLQEAAQGLKLHLRYTGLRRTWESVYLRRAVLRMLQTVPAVRQLLAPILRGRRVRQSRITPAWLTSFSAAQLLLDQPTFDPALELKGNLLGTHTAEDCVKGGYYASRYSLELRHPYRDRRLVEYVLALPAHQLYFQGQYKHVLRTAMQGILPDIIRTRTKPTTLFSLLACGLEHDKMVLKAHVQDPEAAWHKYVRQDWLLDHWNIPVTWETAGAHAIIPWLCVSFSSWYQTHVSEGVDVV